LKTELVVNDNGQRTARVESGVGADACPNHHGVRVAKARDCFQRIKQFAVRHRLWDDHFVKIRLDVLKDDGPFRLGDNEPLGMKDGAANGHDSPTWLFGSDSGRGWFPCLLFLLFLQQLQQDTTLFGTDLRRQELTKLGNVSLTDPLLHCAPPELQGSIQFCDFFSDCRICSKLNTRRFRAKEWGGDEVNHSSSRRRYDLNF
jgi:hypothetical protein